MVCIRTGGDKLPAIFISAGSHSTEQAGVGAAAGLLEELETEHQVYVIPSRDPMGMNGYGYALSLGLGEEPELGSVEDVRTLLKARGEVLYEQDGTVLAIIGEYGYSTTGLLGRFEVGADFLEPLIGQTDLLSFERGGHRRDGALPESLYADRQPGGRGIAHQPVSRYAMGAG